MRILDFLPVGEGSSTSTDSSCSVSIEAMEEGELEALEKSLLEQLDKLRRRQRRLKHARISLSMKDKVAQLEALVSDRTYNIFDPELYQPKALYTYGWYRARCENEKQWERVRQLFLKHRGYDIEKLLDIEAAMNDLGSSNGMKPPSLSSAELLSQVRELKRAVHPDKCKHSRAHEAFIRVVGLTEGPLIDRCFKLLPNVDAVIDALLPPLAATTTRVSNGDSKEGSCQSFRSSSSSSQGIVATSTDNQSLSDEEIEQELHRWYQQPWYQWTQPGFVLPRTFVSREEFEAIEQREMAEYERELLRKRLAREKPMVEDKYVNGTLYPYDHKWWREHLRESKQRDKRNRYLSSLLMKE